MRTIALLILCISCYATAHGAEQKSSELKVAFGLSLPPYVFPENNSGAEFEIVQQAATASGYQMTPNYLPLARVPMWLELRRVDAATPLSDSFGPKLHYSNVHITYQNVAVSLAKKNFKIEKINDLTDKRVAAFQNAKTYLGPDFLKMSQNNSNYLELSEQDKQLSQLYAGETDVIVLDKNIFGFYQSKLKDALKQTPITIHAIFPSNPYKVGFTDLKLRDAFNKGLLQLHQNGKYDAILKKYNIS